MITQATDAANRHYKAAGTQSDRNFRANIFRAYFSVLLILSALALVIIFGD